MRIRPFPYRVLMDAHDMRTLPPDARLERRRQVLKLRKLGWTQHAIAEHTGLSRQGVIDILRRHEREDANGMVDKTRGRAQGEQRSMSPVQEADLRKLICDTTPDQWKMAFALWNRPAVRELILARCGVKLTLQGVGNYLARWGFTPQKPIKKAYEQRPEAVQEWLDDSYPAIARRAHAESEEIHWGDETGSRSDDVRGRSSAPRGQTPVIRLPNRREGLSVISTVTNRGKMRWKVFEGAMNADHLINFMKRLVKDADDRKLFPILDNLKVHHATPVKKWLGSTRRTSKCFICRPTAQS